MDENKENIVTNSSYYNGCSEYTGHYEMYKEQLSLFYLDDTSCFDDEFLYNDSIHPSAATDFIKYKFNTTFTINYKFLKWLLTCWGRETHYFLLYGILCLQRSIHYIFLLYMSYQFVYQQNKSTTNLTLPFVKPGYLTCLQNVSLTIPWIIQLVFFNPYFKAHYRLIERLIFILMKPINSLFGLNTFQLSGICSNPNQEKPFISIPDGYIFIIPALFETFGSWLIILAFVILPWPVSLGLSYVSVVFQMLISFKIFNRSGRHFHKSGILLILTGVVILWIISSTLIDTYIQIYPMENAVDPLQFNLNFPFQKNHINSSSNHPKLNVLDSKVLQYIKLPFGVTRRATLLIVGQLFRVLSVCFQDLIQISTNISSVDSAKTHSVFVSGLSLILIPLLSWILPGNDRNQQLENFTDTMFMLMRNPRLIAISFFFSINIILGSLLASKLLNKTHTGHISLMPILEAFTIIINILFWKSISTPLTSTFHFKYFTFCFIIIGYVLTVTGVLVYSQLIRISWPHMESQFTVKEDSSLHGVKIE